MLTGFNIEGFKSFGSPAVRVALEPLTFIVVGNASGKSNLISALRFFRECFAHGIEVAVNKLDGCREVRNRILRERNEQKLVSICVCGTDLPVKYENGGIYLVSKARCEFSLDLRSDDEQPTIVSEKLSARINGPSGTVDYELVRNGLTV